jgi:hypothetical protein
MAFGFNSFLGNYAVGVKPDHVVKSIAPVV